MVPVLSTVKPLLDGVNVLCSVNVVTLTRRNMSGGVRTTMPLLTGTLPRSGIPSISREQFEPIRFLSATMELTSPSEP